MRIKENKGKKSIKQKDKNYEDLGCYQVSVKLANSNVLVYKI